jgi:hypothetical protein
LEKTMDKRCNVEASWLRREAKRFTRERYCSEPHMPPKSIATPHMSLSAARVAASDRRPYNKSDLRAKRRREGVRGEDQKAVKRVRIRKEKGARVIKSVRDGARAQAEKRKKERMKAPNSAVRGQRTESGKAFTTAESHSYH